MTKAASMTAEDTVNVGASCSVWCSAAALGAGGIQAREKLSLTVLLRMRQESQDALETLGGALMDIDDSTPDEVSEKMAKVKFLSDCVVLKVRALEFDSEHPLQVVPGQLSTMENQFGEVVTLLEDRPAEASAADKAKVQKQVEWVRGQALTVSGQIIRMLVSPEDDVVAKLQAKAETQAIQEPELQKQRDRLAEYVKARQRDLAKAAAREGATAAKRKRTEAAKPQAPEPTQTTFNPAIIAKVKETRDQIKKQVEPKLVPCIDAVEQA